VSFHVTLVSTTLAARSVGMNAIARGSHPTDP
jgi:hypothetical protein